MKLFRVSWHLSKWLAGCLRDVLLVAVWLILGGLLVVQLGVVTSRELPMPAWMLRRIETRLNTAGLRIQIGHATLGTTGRVSLQDIQLMPVSLESPLVTIESLNLRLRTLSLLSGQLEPGQIRVKGLSLWLPAMFSTTGEAEAVISDVNLALRSSAGAVAVEQCSGRFANLTFEVLGTSNLISSQFSKPGTTAKFSGMTDDLLKRYIDYARQLSRFSPELAAFTEPHLSVQILPDTQRLRTRLTFTSRAIDTDLNRFHPNTGRLHATNLRLATTATLASTLPDSILLQASFAEAHTSTGYDLQNVRCNLGLKLFTDGKLPAIAKAAITASTASGRGIRLNHTLVRIEQPTPSNLSAELTTETIGTTWSAGAKLDPEARRGQIDLSGAITPELVKLLADEIGIAPDRLLKVQSNVPIFLSAEFDHDWQFQRVKGHLSSGLVIGYSVPLNSTRADFAYDGTELAVTNIAVTQGENQAQGIYWMNTKTRDFQFLLTGRLRPQGIAGYFEPWWKNFWSYFDFSPAPPVADVSVSGRWGEPHGTTVFVDADVTRPSIRGVYFDHIHTTMFIRPDFYHAFGITLDRDGRTARGSFTRAVDLFRDKDSLKYIDFNITSNLDLAETAKLFSQEGHDTVEPFEFGTPPDLTLSGHVDGPASGRGSHRDVKMDLKSTGSFALYHFPLSDLSFRGTIRDDEIDLTDVQVTFASGRATGSTRIYGPDTDRRLSFDCTLNNALLGEAIGALESYAARERGEKPPAQSRFQQQVAQGRLNLQLAAQGQYSDLFSFFGHGRLDLTSAQLAQVNLLGSLSQLLSKSPIFRFTALQLKEARSSFILERDKLTLPDLKITGTNAIIDTTGTYYLDKNNMDFKARLYPFGQGKNALASAAGFLLVPITNALELKLSGAIDQPNWRFTYGPTNFLYSLTGTNPNEASQTEPDSTDSSHKLPQPYLKH